MKILIIFLFCLSANATIYDCKVLGPTENDHFKLSGKTQAECESWFNSTFNESMQSKCLNGECELVLGPDQTSKYAEESAKDTIYRNMELGKNIIVHVIWLNSVRQISPENKLAFIKLEAISGKGGIMDLLETGNLSLAKTAIQAVEVDGTIVTTELKNAIIAYIESLE